MSLGEDVAPLASRFTRQVGAAEINFTARRQGPSLPEKRSFDSDAARAAFVPTWRPFALQALSSENTKISCEGRHRECPDLVSCILLFASALLPTTRLRGRRPVP